MGAGKEAKEESSTTLKLLKNIISCGGDIKYSVMMINSLLKAKNRYDTYATLDLLMIDNKTLKATFSKNGSPCSYVYRNNELIKIDSASLPIGIIENIKIFDYEVDLKEDDIVIMFSDGIDDNQVKIKDVINACYFEHPQQIAKKLVDNLRDDKVNDDTSVMIIKIKKKV
jgi:stage II sporulation protein E